MGQGAAAMSVINAHLGVAVESRHGLKHEVDTMRAIIDKLAALDPALVDRMTLLWCDSNACAFYDFRFNGRATAVELQEIGKLCEAAVIAAGGGHNGITLGAEHGSDDMLLDPFWGE
jgi:hypothetical protein